MVDETCPVQRLEKPDWGPASPLNDEIAALIEHSYVDATRLLEREFAHNNVLYYTRDDGGRLVTFFMVARENLIVDGRPMPSVFMGLSGTSRQTKGSGVVRRVYQTFLAEAGAWERARGQRLLLWATTATPSAYHALSLLFADVQPWPSGGYTAEGAMTANVLRRLYGLEAAGPTDNPFVLRGVATGTRYSAEEETRIAAICKEKRFDLFDRVGVDQRAGDRLLLVCRVPPSARSEP